MNLFPSVADQYTRETCTAQEAQRIAEYIAWAPVVFQVSRLMVKSVEIRRQGAYRCIALCRNHPCEYGDRSVLALENRLVPAHRPRHTRQSRLQSRCQLSRFVPFGRGTQGGTTCRTANFGSVENHLRRTLAVARAGAEELVRVRSFLQRRIILYGFGYRFRPKAPSIDGCWRQHR